MKILKLHRLKVLKKCSNSAEYKKAAALSAAAQNQFYYISSLPSFKIFK
ncbi:hypothetical protein [Clostridium polynesiense]|nr:hypothetical protein [Clostridium polynesiense]